jgi:hypothetical protein
MDEAERMRKAEEEIAKLNSLELEHELHYASQGAAMSIAQTQKNLEERRKLVVERAKLRNLYPVPITEADYDH